MTPFTLFASLTTAAALGAAGYAAVTGVPVETPAQVSAAPSVAPPQPDAAAVSNPATPAEVAPAVHGEENGPFQPRECRPDEGIIRDCEYL